MKVNQNSSSCTSGKKSTWKRIISLLIATAMLFALSACSSNEPCESCDDTPTKRYTNTYYNEDEYYCADCSSDCAFCSDVASEHYTSGLGIIIFACKDCYAEIKGLQD